jgi:hypothetical protein
VPTILDIATRAGVTTDNVLRVVNGEPVSTEIAARVQAAMQVLGRPAYPPPRESVPALPAERSVELAREQLLGRFAEAAAELETSLPAEVGTVVYEALRVEVRPVAQHVASLQSVFEELADELRHLRREVTAERRDRVDDVALQVDLLRASWQGVDRRLGRIERMLARRDRPEPRRDAAHVVRIEDRRVADPPRTADGNGTGPEPG